MPSILTLSPRSRLILGWVFVLAMLGWAGFRMTRRLAEKPYEDFEAFYLAAQAAATGHDPYRAGTEMYIYLPMLAAWMAPLSRLTMIQAGWVWFALTLAGTLASMGLIWHVLKQRLRWTPSQGDFVLALGITLVLWQTQCRWQFEQGQTDWLTLLALSVALAFLPSQGSTSSTGRRGGALSRVLLPVVVGLALGFAINIKYLPLVMVVYLAIRRQWACVGWSIVATVLWALAPALVYGWNNNLVYLSEGLSGLAKLVGIEIPGQAGYVFPLTYDRSITIPSLWARVAVSNGLGMAFTAGMTLLSVAVVFAVGWMVFRLHRARLFSARGGLHEQQADVRGWVALEWGFMMLLMIVFSPQSQMRHFFLLLPLVLTASGLMVLGATTRIRVLALSALLVGLLGSIGADLVTVFGMRETWKYVSGMSLCTLVMGFLVLAAGFQEMAQRMVKRDAGDAGEQPWRAAA